MPSASAKIEKLASADAADPIKQFSNILEKKVRNLEKRKLKLDNYKSEVQNGKELNEDQKIAVSKYDQVVELLDYSKDLCKSLNSLILETSRLQKKLAKKEQIERQQHEIQRLQEAFYYRHILSCFDNDEVRNDFLHGENGATKLSIEDLAHLDQFYKLVGPQLPNDLADIDSHFHALSENLIFLVEGKNKEIAGTTYKTLKEHLLAIKESGYFSKSSESEELSGDELVELEDQAEKNLEQDLLEETVENTEDNYTVETSHIEIVNAEAVPDAAVIVEDTHAPSSFSPQELLPDESTYNTNSSSTLQDVLSSQGNINFLQESQIELDTPHMDPAVVAVHQVTPPPSSVNFSVAPVYTSSQVIEKAHQSNEVEQAMLSSPPQQVPLMAPLVPRTITPVLTSIQHNDFDPSHPIPTQTFTNQSYAVMQNVIMSPTYVPVPVHHAPLPPHITPIAVALPTSNPVPTASAVPIHVTVAPMVVTSTSPVIAVSDIVLNSELENDEEPLIMNGDLSGSEATAQNSTEKADDSEGYNTQNNFQRGFRGRGRGRGSTNGYFRGRGGYNRGGYQGQNYYQGGNFRRGGPRGRAGGNFRGGGGRGSNFRSQQTQHQ